MRIGHSILAISLFIVTVVSTTAAAQQSSVTVQASVRSQSDGSALYEYIVVNRSNKTIVGLSVGGDYYHGTSDLDTYPRGWTFDSGLQAGTSTSPEHWSPLVITTEESKFIEIEWRNDAATDIQPGQSLSGFGVVLDHPNDKYLSSHYTVYFGDSTAESGSLILAQSARITINVIGQTLLSPGQWQVSLQVANTGGVVARNVLLNKMLLRTLVGTGSVTMVSPVIPVSIGTLTVGSTSTVILVVNAPTAVKKFSLTESGMIDTDAGAKQFFSSAQVVYAKS